MNLPKSKVREYWERYVFNVGCDGIKHLHDVYGKFSDTKKEIWNQIAAECSSNKGFKLSVITYNQMYFTVGYMYKDKDKLMFKVFIPSGDGTMEVGTSEKHDAVVHGVL